MRSITAKRFELYRYLEPYSLAEVSGRRRRQHNLAVPGRRSPKAERHRPGLAHIGPVDRLHVHVRLRAVAGVAALAQHVADPHFLPDPDPHAPLFQVAQRDDHSPGLDEYVIPCESGPSRSRSAALGEGVPDRRESAISGMVGFAAVGRDNGSLDRCQDVPTEAGKSV